jgi:hypothetical protein
MNKYIKGLIGLKITSAKSIHDYHQLCFEQDVILSIYNPINYISLEVENNIESLKEKILQDVNIEENTISLIFSGNSILKIDMREEESYQCPEAMTLHKFNSPIVVWRYED